jgi:hypothetical protein
MPYVTAGASETISVATKRPLCRDKRERVRTRSEWPLDARFLRGSTHFFCGHRSSEIQMRKIWRKLPECNRLHAPAVTNVWHEDCLHLNSGEKHFYKQMTFLHWQTSKKGLTRAVFTSFPVSSTARSTDSVSSVKRWVSDVIFRFASPRSMGCLSVLWKKLRGFACAPTENKGDNYKRCIMIITCHGRLYFQFGHS